MSSEHTAAVLFTIHLERIARFYEQVVGMRPLKADADHRVLEKNAFRLVVHQIPQQYASSIVISVPPKVRELSAIKLSFAVESLARSRDAAARLGGCVYGTEKEWEYEGTVVCDGWDPDGNVFQLFQPVTS
jgi:predicted enzyme related to lactoylglutathione lyase